MIVPHITGIHTLKCPTGRWTLVGTVPVGLVYEQADGTPLTDKQAETIAHCGPGLLRDKVRPITYATREEAQAGRRALRGRTVGPARQGVEPLPLSWRTDPRHGQARQPGTEGAGLRVPSRCRRLGVRRSDLRRCLGERQARARPGAVPHHRLIQPSLMRIQEARNALDEAFKLAMNTPSGTDLREYITIAREALGEVPGGACVVHVSRVLAHPVAAVLETMILDGAPEEIGDDPAVMAIERMVETLNAHE